MSGNSFSRRDFLKVSGTGIAAAGLLGCSTGSTISAQTTTAGKGTPRRIIFMVSDGMSLGVPSLAEHFSQLVRGKGTAMAAMMRDSSVAHGFFETHSLSSMVTDSAAASTSWGSGSRVFNGSINVLPDGTAMKPICHVAHDLGKRTGLVTTTRITHATPAGFGSASASRGDEDDIAPQYLDQIDVLMGGGLHQFDPAKRKDGRDLLAEYRKAGYQIYTTKKDLAASKLPDRVLGLFWGSHVPYTLDWNNVPEIQESVPTLAEMTKAAIEVLDRHPDGFLMQVEGGRVDHAAHGNDAAALMWDQVAFDDAVAVALDYARQTGDTLVIVTSDHGNSNPGLNGMGRDYNDSTACFGRIAKATKSYELFSDDVNALKKSSALNAATLGKLVSDSLALEFSDDEVQAVLRALSGEDTRELNVMHRGFSGMMGQAAGNHNGIFFTGTNHTEDAVLLLATGPGSSHFNGLVKNIDAFPILVGMMGSDFRNPSMDAAAARQYLSSARPFLRLEDWA